MNAALTLLMALIGFAAGSLVLPWAVDAILKAKYAAFRTWWASMLELYAQWTQAHGDAQPSPRARGREGALGIWASDCRRLACEGDLTREQVRALRASGFEV